MRGNRALFGSAVIAVAVFGAASLVANAEFVRVETKTITLDCAPGWRAGAGGSYGGVGFNLDCKNGRSNVKLKGMVGTAYNIRVGVEGDVAGDCAYFGDAETAEHTCIAVRVLIR